MDQRVGVHSLALSFDLSVGLDDMRSLEMDHRSPWVDELSQTIQNFPNVRDVYIVLSSYTKGQNTKIFEDKILQAVMTRLQVDRSDSHMQHDEECRCIFQALPEIKCTCFDHLKDELDADEVRIDGGRVSSLSLK